MDGEAASAIQNDVTLKIRPAGPVSSFMCSITIQTISPDQPGAERHDSDRGATVLRVSTWGDAGFEFTDADPVDLSDLEQTLEYTYLAGVRDSGGDMDVAIARYRAMRRGEPAAAAPSAEQVVAALEQGGSLVAAAAYLKIDGRDLKSLIIQHQIQWPRPSVGGGKSSVAADIEAGEPPLAVVCQ